MRLFGDIFETGSKFFRRLGKPGSPDFLMFFFCKAMGDVLMECTRNHPEKQLTVLCDNTPESGTVQILSNHIVYNRNSRYGSPGTQKTFAW